MSVWRACPDDAREEVEDKGIVALHASDLRAVHASVNE
jgi:hypothetical protein